MATQTREVAALLRKLATTDEASKRVEIQFKLDQLGYKPEPEKADEPPVERKAPERVTATAPEHAQVTPRRPVAAKGRG